MTAGTSTIIPPRDLVEAIIIELRQQDFETSEHDAFLSFEEAATRLAAKAMAVIKDNGATRILAERARQVLQHNLTIPNDRALYDAGAAEAGDVSDLAFAAAAYAIAEPGDTIQTNGVRGLWPWEATSFKPTTRLRALEKAGALIAAEIDRILTREATQ